ncbi:hypothetical protein L228DRAFT_264542 [Xylona heveae TC161]|uniref:Uncharacterized protein n=1 Tax=Xylona heveae (strain CBS 132557 / TC161) TaxID=1328760 RepID=A0A165JE13_XYLHT|nr:hypothetical protein L228DRAFT_264542 [Xylona heveae TC161]KZF26116.1 hypothetical protein L228DRAFT_264542 [Xylona heveae TC161]
MSEPSADDNNNNNNNDDARLLARLNALKPSHVQLTSTPSLARAGDSSSFDLSSRFLRLSNNGSTSTSAAGTRHAGQPNKVPDDSFSGNQGYDPEDERTLEELLEDLGPEEQWQLDPAEEKNIQNLLTEAEAALPKADAEVSKYDQGAEHEEPANQTATDTGRRTLHMPPPPLDPRHPTEDEEAAEYVAKVFAELETEKVDEEADTGNNNNDSVLPAAARTESSWNKGGIEQPSERDEFMKLPVVPTALPEARDDLAARLQSLGLPSAPKFHPAQKPPKILKKTNALPQYTDEDIESWCVICNEDATIRCLGCDGDLYCKSCWQEGHSGPDAGFDERHHKWTKYARSQGFT